MLPRLRLTTTLTAAAVVALPLVACEDDNGTAPPETGRAQMLVQDDPASREPSALSTALADVLVAELAARIERGESLPVRALDGGPVTPAALAAQQNSVQGQITADAAAAVSADGTTWVELGAPETVVIEIQTAAPTDIHGEVEVEGGTYSRFRLVLENTSATLEAGSIINGFVLIADVDFVLGGSDGAVTLEFQVPTFEIDADTRATLRVELNVEDWANQENAQDRQIEDEEMQQSSTGSAETESSPQG